MKNKISLIVKYPIILQYIRYLIIGVISNIYSFVVYKISNFIGFEVDISSIYGMLVGIFNTYILSRIYMKESVVLHSNKRLFFFLIYYILAIYVTSQSIEILGNIDTIGNNISWLFCTIVASICNFIFLSFITLKTD